jgi:hypothetical protein
MDDGSWIDAGVIPAGSPSCRSLAIVGAFGGTHIAGALKRAATKLALETITFDVADAAGRIRLLRLLTWHLAGRRPPYLDRFSAKVLAGCVRPSSRILIATGAAPLTRAALHVLRARGITTINYSTDDPWNPVMRAGWYLRALSEYGVVFTPRRANIENFRAMGCQDVRYLPFGYDETLCRPPEAPVEGVGHDILFVGGADEDRADFMTAFIQSGQAPSPTLVGGYWERYAAMRPLTLGQKPPDTVAALTVAAKVNLCLVRRANRDGHVMRSFEIAALGGCMLAEDTAEHREIFGPDGETVVYFHTPQEAAARARLLLADPALRHRLAAAVQARITRNGHTYRDRLRAMLTATAQDP